MRTTLLYILAIILSGAYYQINAQEIKAYEIPQSGGRNDSVPVLNPDEYLMPTPDTSSNLNKIEWEERQEEFNLSSDKTSQFYIDMEQNRRRPIIPGTAYIPTWKNGGVLATGSISEFPGMMSIHTGAVGLIQNYGKWNLYIGGEANKYGYFNGLHTQYGINGSISYSISPLITLTGYGTYYFGRAPMMANGMPMSPGMLGYFSASNFGATAEFQFNETFGLIVGGEAVQEIGTNRYRFEPIVTPTIKIGKVKIGIPVGEIVNDAIRSHLEHRRHR